MNHRQSPQAFFGLFTAIVIHLRQIAIATLDGGRTAMKVSRHPLCPFQPALLFAYRQSCRESIGL